MKKSVLPGIGNKITFQTKEQKEVSLILHHSGQRELYFLDSNGRQEPEYSLSLTMEEARDLGAQLLGITLPSVDTEQIRMFKNQVVVEWLRLSDSSPLVGKSIEQSRIRSQTGALVIGIVRHSEVIAFPDLQSPFEAGDTLIATGKREQIDEFVKQYA